MTYVSRRQRYRRPAPPTDQRIVFYDLETGGLTTRHPTIQIAATACRWDIDGRHGDAAAVSGTPPPQFPLFAQVAEFECKLQFQLELADPKALEANSYDAAVWEVEAVPLRDGLEEFSRFLREHATFPIPKKAKPSEVWYAAQMAGHNIARFDDKFIRRDFKNPEWQAALLKHDGTDPFLADPGRDIFCPAGYIVLDTFQLATWHQLVFGAPGESLRLEALAKRFGILPEGEDQTHDAMDDLKLTVAVAERLLSETTSADMPLRRRRGDARGHTA